MVLVIKLERNLGKSYLNIYQLNKNKDKIYQFKEEMIIKNIH